MFALVGHRSSTMESRSKPPSERCHTFKVRLGPIRLNFNPVVTVLSGVIIWGFVIWCVVDTARASENMSKTKTWLTKTFTWFYIASMNVLILFLFYLYFSKYSDLRLGKDDEKPEFSDASYFSMLFAAGIGIGLFYFGVTEPIWHYEPNKNGTLYGNRYWGRYVNSILVVLIQLDGAEGGWNCRLHGCVGYVAKSIV